MKMKANILDPMEGRTIEEILNHKPGKGFRYQDEIDIPPGRENWFSERLDPDTGELYLFYLYQNGKRRIQVTNRKAFLEMYETAAKRAGSVLTAWLNDDEED